MSSWPTETLAWWRNFLNVTVIVLAIATGGVMFLRYLVERELDRRRTTEEKALRDQMTVSKQDAETARREAERLRERLKPRDVPSEKREAMLSVLRREKGKVKILYITDPETQVLAKRLAALIREAGWETTQEGGSPFGAIVGLRLDIKQRGKCTSLHGRAKRGAQPRIP